MRGARLALLAVLLGAAGCTSESRGPVAQAPSPSVPSKSSAEVCAARYPDTLVADASKVRNVRVLGPRPSDQAVARRIGNFKLLGDDVPITLCLRRGGDVVGVPDEGQPEVLWHQSGVMDRLAWPM